MPSGTEGDENLHALLAMLTSLHAPSGYESVVTDVLAERWLPLVDEVSVDSAGNLIAEVGGSGPRLALVSHSDEICMTVREVRPDGFLAVVGGQRHARETVRDYAIASGQVVTILTPERGVAGILGARTGHLLRDDGQASTWEDLFVDIGVNDDQEAKDLGVRAGCPVVWSPPLRRVGRNVVAKAIDNRIAILAQDALLRTVSRSELEVDLVLVCTAREEYGLIGSSALGRTVALDGAIVLDVAPAGDTPAGAGDSTPVGLGAGPVLVHKDGGSNGTRYDRRLNETLERLAITAGIPLQHAVFGRYGTDGGALMQHGIPSAVVAVPTRFTHSPVETVRMHDVETTIRLLHSALTDEALPSALNR